MSFVKRGDALPILHTVEPESVEDEKFKKAKKGMKALTKTKQPIIPDIENTGNKIESN